VVEAHEVKNGRVEVVDAGWVFFRLWRRSCHWCRSYGLF
jgi:hypothetical protein